MDEREALSRMVPPGQTRPGKPRGGVIQIHLTRACDKSCYNCTQGSNYRGPITFISDENFEKAVVSLKDYFGIVGIFGGNPCLHPRFEFLCEILRAHIPQERCGLWSNRIFKHGETCRKTFNPAVSNLNVHLDETAYREFLETWPEARPFGLHQDSRHSPVYVSMTDINIPEEDRWELISNCDINQHWSAMICEFRGKLRGFFCEIAAAQAILHQTDHMYPDTGIPVECECEGSGTINTTTARNQLYVTNIPCKCVDGTEWWEKPIREYSHQVWWHCHDCGVPLRGYGALAQGENGTEQVSETHMGVAEPRKKSRNREIVRDLVQLNTQGLKFTDYLGGAKK